jgi:hypothetical protein
MHQILYCLYAYIVFIAMYIKYNVKKLVADMCRPRPMLTRVNKRIYRLEFYIGETKCRLLVKRTPGPCEYYMVSSTYDDTDITEEIMPYMAATPVAPTPGVLGYDTISLWDMNDDEKCVFPDEVIR